MHLTDKAHAYARTLSGGMKRRLLVAKAMVHSPPILVLDEPTAGVDVELRRQLWAYVRSLNAQGVTIVLTTHYLEEAEQLCDRIAIIHHGRVIANEPTRELVSKAQEKAVVVTFDRDIAEVPVNPCFENIALIDERTLEITFRKDKVNAGAGLNDLRVVEHVVEEAPRAIGHLIDLGVPFASENGALHLPREGGHSHRRIVHVADATGWAISQALEAAAAKHPNITLVPDMVAIDLVTGRHATHFSTSGAVHGLYAWNRKTKRVEVLTGRATILASSGAGRAQLHSSAPRGATGDGIAMAWRAGCPLSNTEFLPLHPPFLFNHEVDN